MSTLTGPRVDQDAVLAPTTSAKPSAAWYWIAALIAMIGATTSIAWGATRAWDAYKSVDSFARNAIPGEVVVVVDEPGQQIVYYEGDFRPQASDIVLEVRGPSGDKLAIVAYGLDLRYDFEGRVAKAIATFDATSPGRYVASASSAPEAGAVLAIGEDLTAIFPIVLWALGLVLVSLIAGAAVAGVTHIKRSRA